MEIFQYLSSFDQISCQIWDIQVHICLHFQPDIWLVNQLHFQWAIQLHFQPDIQKFSNFSEIFINFWNFQNVQKFLKYEKFSEILHTYLAPPRYLAIYGISKFYLDIWLCIQLHFQLNIQLDICLHFQPDIWLQFLPDIQLFSKFSEIYKIVIKFLNFRNFQIFSKSEKFSEVIQYLSSSAQISCQIWDI